MALLLVVALGFILFIGFLPAGGQLAGRLISSLASGPDRGVTITAPRGLLTGNLQVESVALSDSQGVYARADDITVDWSPLSLLRGTFHADSIRVGNLTVNRAPAAVDQPQTQDQTASGSGFSLPVAVKVERIDLPNIDLQRELAGRPFQLAAEGAADATDERVALQLSAKRKDAPNALAKTDLVFAPAQNELKLQALISEPQGGLLARLLHLPGAPSLALALDGRGPLSNWTGELRGTVDGKPVISIDGKHVITPQAAHSIHIEGGGQLAELLPPTIRPLFIGRTDVIVTANIGTNGRIEIKNGTLTNGAMKLSASGALDPSGDNSLTGSLAAANGPVQIEWPLNGQPARFALDNLNFTLTGPAESSRFNATAALRTATVGGARLGQIRLQAESEDLNLVTYAGSVRTRLSAAQADFDEPNLDRLIDGPIRLDAPIRLAMPAIGLDAATFESANLSGTISGAYNQSKQSVTGNIRLSLNPAGLPEAVGRNFSESIGLEGYIDSIIGGRMSLENIVLKSNVLDGHGSVVLEGGKLDGQLAGRIADIAKLRKDAKGPVGYDLRVSGPLDAITLKGVLNAAEMRISGHTLQALSTQVQATNTPDGLKGTVVASGTLDAKPIRLETAINRVNGQLSLPQLGLEAGPNRLSGALDLSEDFLPAGQLTFDFPDLGLLAGLAGQKAEGNLKGTVTLTNAGDVAAATITASGQALTAQGATLTNPEIDLASTDLAALRLQGTLRADQLSAGGQTLSGVALSLAQEGNRTTFDLAATYSNAPLALSGALNRTPESGDLTLRLDRFSATPGGVAVRLSEPADIRLRDGNVVLETIRLAAGGGQVLLEGSASDQLNLAMRINRLPAALANGFVPELGAEGEIGGVVTVGGPSTKPVVRYSLAWEDAKVARAAEIGPFGLSLRGRFETGVATIDAATLEGDDGLSLRASGTVATADPGALDLTVDLDAVPAAFANRFRPQLQAEGTVSGIARIAGSFDAPQVRFDLALKDGSTAQTRNAGLAGLTADAIGSFENNTVAVQQLTIGGGDGISARANGSLNLAGERQLNLNVTIDALPANLIDIARPGLGAEGRLTGTASVAGTLAAPQADFNLTWNDGSLAQTRSAALGPLSLTASGRFADQVLTLNEARLSGQNGLAMTANGTAGLAAGAPLSITATFNQLPASLANVARPDLAASGLLNGSVTASGTLQAPNVGYDISLADGSTAQTRQAGVNAIAARARGTFAPGQLTLDETVMSDPSGLSVTANGRVQLADQQPPSIDVNATIAALPANLANAFLPDLGAAGMISGTVASTGAPDAPSTRFDLAWADAGLNLTRSAGLAGLAVRTRGSLVNGTLTLDEASLDGPSGLSATASGTVGLTGERPLNLTARLQSVPADLANAFLPGIRAGGTITGNAAVTGTVASPNATYDLQWADGVIQRQGDAGIRGLNLRSAGSFADNRLTLSDTRLTGPEGLSVTANGSVAFGENGPQPNLNAEINALPARLANAVQPGLDAAGTISGRVSALPANGAGGGRFDLRWNGASLAQTRSAGLAPFDITASGTLGGERLEFDTRLSGASGLNVTGNGRVGLSGERPLDVRVNGTLPFALAAAQLSGQGLALEGSATVNVAIGGTAAAPAITGTASTSGAQLIDVRRNLALNGISANVTFNRDSATISNLTANVSTGGTVSVQGSIGLRDGYAADLRILLDNATYVDGNLVTATVNGTLNLNGPLIQTPTLSGEIALVRANITVPASLPASLAQIDVKHVNAPPDVRALLASLAPKGGSGTSAGTNLDLTLRAPNGIFVRGRGIDAELGGSLTIRGTTAAPNVAGAFEMRRGRIVILTKRLDFTTGRITFGGSLIPVLDLAATTSSGQTTITITVTGQANDPDIGFSSSPSLPQDEILAQLIFGQSLSRLSALQIAQLADAVAQLAGGGDNSLLQSLRSSLGVDDLDIKTDEAGQTSVSIGRRLNNRTYLQLEQGGSGGGARATINLDIGRGVKLKGSAGSDGGSGGIFYEKEY
ncbi:translocation/assembly module TamB domain-containing protein [Rhizobium sp. SL86]|uniref:translocation/assembly module TamB domain-containing protein n=1 Tax=Rhizobium sp. SL86 TaxID=2995148 RepID=UPI002274CB42|nr:translocation/assembly module TamB domain-containing protein [Rhizobium sp. SL86]MCY1665724.1 translocation/assembly module TamB domain-containing protein [Rhizobium sp. SL86]